MFELNEEDKKLLIKNVNKIVKKLCLKKSLYEALSVDPNLQLPAEANLGQPLRGRSYTSNTGLMINHYNLHIQPLLLCNEQGDVLRYNGTNNDPVPVRLLDYCNISPMSLNRWDTSSVEYALARKMVYYLLQKLNLLTNNVEETQIKLYPSGSINRTLSSLANNRYPNCSDHKDLLFTFLHDNPTLPLKADYFLEDTDKGLAINNQVIYKLKLIDITLYFKQLQVNASDNDSNVNPEGFSNYNLISNNILSKLYSNYPYRNDFTNTRIIIDRYVINNNHSSTTHLLTLNSTLTNTNPRHLVIFGPRYSWDVYNNTGSTYETVDDTTNYSTDDLRRQKIWATGRVLVDRFTNFDNWNLTPNDLLVDNTLATNLYNQITDKISIQHPCKIIIPQAILSVSEDGTNISDCRYDWDLPNNYQEVMILAWYKKDTEVRGTKYIENFLNSGQNLFVSVSLQDAAAHFQPIIDRSSAGAYINKLNNNDIHNFAVEFASEGSWEEPNTYQRPGSNVVTDYNKGRLRLNVSYDDLISFLNNYEIPRLGYLNFILDTTSFMKLGKVENFLRDGIKSNIIYEMYTTGTITGKDQSNPVTCLQIYADEKTSAGFNQFLTTYGSTADIQHHDDKVIKGFKGIIAYYYVLSKIAAYFKDNIAQNISLNKYFIVNQKDEYRNILLNLNTENIITFYKSDANFNNSFNTFINYIQSKNLIEDDINTLKEQINETIIQYINNLNLPINLNSNSPLGELVYFFSISNLQGNEVNTFIQAVIAYLTRIKESAQNNKDCLTAIFQNIIEKCETDQHSAIKTLEEVLQNSLIHRSNVANLMSTETSTLVDTIFTNLNLNEKRQIVERMLNAADANILRTYINMKIKPLWITNIMSILFENLSEGIINTKSTIKSKLKEHLKQQLKIKK